MATKENNWFGWLKSKWVVFGAVPALIIGLVAVFTWNTAARSSGNGLNPLGGNPPPAPELTVDDYLRDQQITPKLGVFEANDTELNGISVPAKRNAKMQILGNIPVAFTYYVDGNPVQKWGATGKRDNLKATNSGEHTEGYKLEPGNPVHSVRVAYIIYKGPEPTDDKWIDVAQDIAENQSH